MKVSILVSLVLCGMGLSSSYTRVFCPPGTIKIMDSLYMDVAEVTNQAWLEYAHSVGMVYGKNSHQYRSCLPDTTVWLNLEAPDSLMCSTYFRSTKYRQHPVVGISYQQALDFCEWRTRMVKWQYARLYHHSLNISYRLPTEKEWEMVAYYEGLRLRDPKGMNLATPAGSKTESQGPCATRSKKKDLFGINHLLGNVAEMVADPGIAKGGSWKHDANLALTGKRLSYTKPQVWLGFRCTCIYRF